MRDGYALCILDQEGRWMLAAGHSHDTIGECITDAAAWCDAPGVAPDGILIIGHQEGAWVAHVKPNGPELVDVTYNREQVRMRKLSGDDLLVALGGE